MRGGEWIVPVVVLIVWLISTILKSRENDEPVRPRQPGAAPGRKPTGDIDKFLQEIDRLRRKSAEEQGQTARAAPPPPPRVRPVASPPPRSRPASRIQLAAQPVLIEAVPAVTAAPLVVPPLPAAVPAVAKPLRVGSDHRQSVGATAALHLLRSPRTIAAAVVLQEVFGPPKCRR